MKAAIIEKAGAAAKFRIKELPRPLLKQGQILIQNFASSVNPVDLIMRQSKSWLTNVGLSNQVIGNDFCGQVMASKSKIFKEGDEVFGMCPIIKGGAYAEELVVHDSHAALKPNFLSFAEVGVIPLVGLTAYQALYKIGKLQHGENVLITGCTGGVGSAAVQLAKRMDCHISGLCSEEHRGAAHALGCDVVIDYRQQQIPSGARFDLIFDAAGKYTYSDLRHHITEQGLFITTRGETYHIKGMIRTTVDLVLEPQMKFVFVKPDGRDLVALKAIIERDELKLPVAKTFDLTQLTAAHNMMQHGGFVGKIGVKISDSL